MTLNELNGEIKKSDVVKLRREVRPQIKAVEELSKTAVFIPTYAVEHMKRLDKQMKKTTLKNMSQRELRNYYRDLLYIKNNLKSSTIEGALQVSESFEKTMGSFLKNMSDDEKKEFFKVYDKFYGKVGEQIGDKFKYEVFEFSKVIFEKEGMGYKTLSADELAKTLSDKLESITKESASIRDEYGNIISRAEQEQYVKLRFTEYLRGVRS